MHEDNHDAAFLKAGFTPTDPASGIDGFRRTDAIETTVIYWHDNGEEDGWMVLTYATPEMTDEPVAHWIGYDRPADGRATPPKDMSGADLLAWLNDVEADEAPAPVGAWMICPACGGDGHCVNPNIDCNGLTADDFAEDPEFAEDYMGGLYDVSCAACGGSGKIREGHLSTLRQHADDRRLAAQEDGRWGDLGGIGDFRFG